MCQIHPYLREDTIMHGNTSQAIRQSVNHSAKNASRPCQHRCRESTAHGWSSQDGQMGVHRKAHHRSDKALPAIMQGQCVGEAEVKFSSYFLSWARRHFFRPRRSRWNLTMYESRVAMCSPEDTQQQLNTQKQIQNIHQEDNRNLCVQ